MKSMCKKPRFLYALTFVVGVSLLFAACRREYNFDFEDGIPGKGADGSSVTVDTSIKSIDASKFAKARVFPGLVCNDEPRLMNQDVTLDLDYFYVTKEQLRMSTIPEPQFSTGMYAGPGELVIVDVPAGLNSLSIQIGAWTYDASAVQNSQRDPVIYLKDKLVAGRNYFRNLYGGPIYIIASRPVETPVTLKFSNVVKMPDYILGQTNEAQWQAAIRSSCVPWLELRSENMIFTVPRDYCVNRNISALDVIMNGWNDAIKKDYYEWIGLKEAPAPGDEVDQAPILPWRAVLDITINPGAGGVSGYPFRALMYWFPEWTDPQLINNAASWGTFHEIGHNHQQGQYWSWSSLGETTNNLFIFKNAKRLGVYPAKHTYPVDDLAGKITPAVTWAASAVGTRNFDGTEAVINDPFARLTPFLQIFNKVPANWGYAGQPWGWDFMGYIYKRARRAIRISTNDQQKRDFFYEAICDYTRTDWIPFFQQWGIAVSATVAARISSQYPVMKQKIWEYNPITQTGGDGSFVYWSITGSSEETSGEGAVNGRLVTLLDGDLNTYWHSKWSSPAANPPHTITVDMRSTQSIKGFQIAQRPGGTTPTSRAVKNVRIEVSTNGTTWTAVTGSPFTLENERGMQNLNLPAPISVRYFRLTIASTADVYDGTNFAALSEINVIK